MNNPASITNTQKLYNFSELIPDAQEFLFKQILYFDIAANHIAKATDQMVISARNFMLKRITAGCSGTSPYVEMYFGVCSEMHQLPKDCFKVLTLDSQHFALFLGNLMIHAIEELQAVTNDDRSTYEIEKSLEIEVNREFEGCSQDEIAMYFKKIDTHFLPLPSLPSVFFLVEVA